MRPFAELEEKAKNFEPISFSQAAKVLKLGFRHLERLSPLCLDLKLEVFGEALDLHYTGPHFPAVSVTGASCELSCEHCKAELLRRLPSVRSGEELLELAMFFASKGAKGILLTGGCTRGYEVPLQDFLHVVPKLKRIGLRVIAHPGLVEGEKAEGLRCLDAVLVDVVGSVGTSRSVYGIGIERWRYVRCLKGYEELGIKVSPHVCVGLERGKLSHELGALRIVKESLKEPLTLVLIGLMPLVTNHKASSLNFARVIVATRLLFPRTRIAVGCAKSSGREVEVIETFAANAGVNAISVPTEASRRKLEEEHEVRVVESCCCLPA